MVNPDDVCAPAAFSFIIEGPVSFSRTGQFGPIDPLPHRPVQHVRRVDSRASDLESPARDTACRAQREALRHELDARFKKLGAPLIDD
jgi:hypothetical protein